jgi:hypothetical protein
MRKKIYVYIDYLKVHKWQKQKFSLYSQFVLFVVEAGIISVDASVAGTGGGDDANDCCCEVGCCSCCFFKHI